MWTIATIILGSLALFFVIAALLLEITKIRRALEHMAYRKEIHEIIETDYIPEVSEGGEDGEVSADSREAAETAGERAKKAIKSKPAPAPVRRYRKTKIKVIAEGDE